MLVSFMNIQDVYSSDSEMEVELSFEKGFNVSPNDWVGLFKVGWASFEDAITSISFSSFIHNKTFTIKANYLPSLHSENLSDHYFYQLCYISQNDLKGVSDIFKFKNGNEENYKQNISDEIYKIIERNKNIYNYEKIKELEKQIETLTFCKDNLEKNNTILKERLNNFQHIGPHDHKAVDYDAGKHIYPSKEMINVTLNTSSEMDEYFSDAESFNQLYNNISRPIGFVIDQTQAPRQPHPQQNSIYQPQSSQESYYPQASYPPPNNTPTNPGYPPHPSYFQQPSYPPHPSHNASVKQSNIPPRRPFYPPNLPPKPQPRNNAG